MQVVVIRAGNRHECLAGGACVSEDTLARVIRHELVAIAVDDEQRHVERCDELRSAEAVQERKLSSQTIGLLVRSERA